ncbi:MAG: bifunctional folylpolyglutamate synthase/dihydrofolate synthase [Thermodesulfobacteriota bacterium]
MEAVITPKVRYQEAVNRLYGLQKYGIKFGLSKTTNLLQKFGNPQAGQRYIHIAGTNGKGSVAAFIGSILQEAGLKVGLYSSPHLVRFTERFRINNREMDQDTATELIEALDAVFVQEEPPTFFEATTAMALIYFAREKTDVSILEVGMGGRLDATNVITPMVSGITSIGMEHREFLGDRLTDIAAEKAGIIKPGVDVITSASQPAVVDLLQATALQKDAQLWRVGKEIRYRATRSGFHYTGPGLGLKGVTLGLKGTFQNRNAALALGIVERLIQKGYAISPKNIIDGLAHTHWPGRMQVVNPSPLIIIDGAHNPAAIRSLAASVCKEFRYRRMILVIGVMADKALYPVLKGIVPLADYIIYTRPAYARAAPPERLMATAAPLGKPGETAVTLSLGLNRAREMADSRDMILVCGSLFTVGEALTYFDPVEYRPDE